MTRKRADSAEFEKRIAETIGKIARCDGTASAIVQSIAESWAITTRQGWNYYHYAMARIRKVAESKQKTLLGETLARHDLLRKIGFDDKDYRLVLDTDKEDAKLLGLYAPERHEVNLSGTDLDAAIERELARLAGASEEGAAGEDDRT